MQCRYLVAQGKPQPGASGLEICRQLMGNSELANIPVFMLTAKGQSEDRERGLNHGVKKYITKPFSPKVLLAIVLEELNNK